MKQIIYYGMKDGTVFRLEGEETYRLLNGQWNTCQLYGEVEIETTKRSKIKAWALEQAVKNIKEFVVEDKPPGFDKHNIFYESGDENCRFISEGFLYPLLGKEDARSVLARFNRLESIIKAL